MAQKTGRKHRPRFGGRGWSGPRTPLGLGGGGMSPPSVNTDWEKRREERKKAREERRAERDARLADLDTRRQGAGLPAMGNPLATGIFGPDAATTLGKGEAMRRWATGHPLTLSGYPKDDEEEEEEEE